MRLSRRRWRSRMTARSSGVAGPVAAADGAVAGGAEGLAVGATVGRAPGAVAAGEGPLGPSRTAGAIGSGDGAAGMGSPPMLNGSGPSRAAAPRGGGATCNAGVAACSGRAEAGERGWACPGLVSDGSSQISRSGARCSRKRHKPGGRPGREKLSASGRNRWPSSPCMGLSDEGNTDPGRRPKF